MSILKVANVHFDSAGTNRIDYLGDDKVRITSANGTVLSGATNDALLRITQTGTGHALVVEDSANPDSTPFVIDANGNIGIGTLNLTPTPNFTEANTRVLKIAAFNSFDYAVVQLESSTQSGSLFLYGPSAENEVGVPISSIVTQNSALSLGAVGNGTTNTSILFSTDSGGAFTERMRITATGNVLIGRTDSIVGLGVKLDVNGSINCSNIFVNGNVVSGGGGSVTITDQTTVTPLQYLTFTTTTSGTASSINVASTKLTFNVNTGTLSSTIFNSTSDINKKTNIQIIDNSLEVLDALSGYRFNWKDNGLPSLGVIAQEVETVLPELIGEDNSVNYNGIIAVLIQAVKELKAEIEVLKNR